MLIFILRINIVILIFLNLQNLATSTDTPELHSKAFSRHFVIHPRLFHGIHKRSITTTLDKENLLHEPYIMLSYQHQGKSIHIDLHLNEHLLPVGHFLRYQYNETPNSYIVKNYTMLDVELCHYQGTIRGISNSRVAVSTCNGGINGLVYDGIETYFIQSAKDYHEHLEDKHFLFRQSDLIRKHDKINNYRDNIVTQYNSKSSMSERFPRLKRAASNAIHAPYNANERSSYVELLLVVDKQLYLYFERDMRKIHNTCKDLANIMNTLYMPLNIFIVLIGVVVWSESNEIDIASKSLVTLNRFTKYRHEKLVRQHPNDVAQLLVLDPFDKNVLGKAHINTMCTAENSASIITYEQKVNALVASVMTHELGHNFGMGHDESDCKCPEEQCIMSATSSASVHWSSCSLESLNIAFSHGLNYCLRNKPTKLFEAPQCGNGFVEAQEQCDCGPANQCTNPCCDAQTCRLQANATCATGVCCDLATCRPKAAGSECRATAGMCDLPEYCNGNDEFCPRNVFQSDLTPCDNGSAHCYQGSCRSHTQQCRLLWGASGVSATQCYAQNSLGKYYGNCGYDRVTQQFKACAQQDVACGRLHCNHLNVDLDLGVSSTSNTYSVNQYVKGMKNVSRKCSSAMIDVGLQHTDPGLTPDGVKCDENHICIAQKCRAIAQLQADDLFKQCAANCSANGVCNSNGNCHCDIGFGGASCTEVGAGGSVDSGPATNPNYDAALMRFVYIFLCAVLPLMLQYIFLLRFWRPNATDYKLYSKTPTVTSIHDTCTIPKTSPSSSKIDVTTTSLNSNTNQDELSDAMP